MDVLSLAHLRKHLEMTSRLRRLLMITANMGKADETEVFRPFISFLFFNKRVHFPCFLSGSWTCLDFSFLPVPAALDCAIFFLPRPPSFVHIISRCVSMNELKHSSVKCHIRSGLNLEFVQSVTTLELD